jgi:PTS system ascorbate-specific IIB component
MKIVTICGAGIGSSGILKVNAERVLAKLDIEADVVAADIGSTFADVIVIQNHFDQAELTEKLQKSLG